MIDSSPAARHLTALTSGAASDASPEVTDGKAVLAALQAADTAYQAKVRAFATWRASYQRAFGLLDKHARYTLSLKGPAPAAIPFTDMPTAHNALASRADAAASSGAAEAVLTDLTRVRAAFDTAWGAKPVDPDSSAEGTALHTAIASANASSAFLEWAKANPT